MIFIRKYNKILTETQVIFLMQRSRFLSASPSFVLHYFSGYDIFVN